MHAVDQSSAAFYQSAGGDFPTSTSNCPISPLVTANVAPMCALDVQDYIHIA